MLFHKNAQNFQFILHTMHFNFYILSKESKLPVQWQGLVWQICTKSLWQPRSPTIAHLGWAQGCPRLKHPQSQESRDEQTCNNSWRTKLSLQDSCLQLFLLHPPRACSHTSTWSIISGYSHSIQMQMWPQTKIYTTPDTISRHSFLCPFTCMIIVLGVHLCVSFK